MKKIRIKIDYPIEKMELSRKRWDAAVRFQYYDRVPVLFCLVARYFAPIFKLNYKDFFADAETQFYWQLQFAKYRLEHIPEDYCCEPVIYVTPYFDNVVNASAFGAEIGWHENQTPRAIPFLTDYKAVEQFKIAKPDSGLWGKQIQWWLKMKELAAQTEITFSGRPGRVDVGPLSIGAEGPHMTAIDLAGEDFYWWMLDNPGCCQLLMDKITTSMIQAETYFRTIDPRSRMSYGIAEDAAQFMSAELFKEFSVRYDNMLYDHFGAGLQDGRGMHMCGNSIHLHQVLLNDAKITQFILFGYPVKPEIAAKNFGGKVRLWGNINPMLMLSGTKEEVKAAAMDCLSKIAPCGGFVLGDGANVCPDTPLENLAALVDTATEYGMLEPASVN